MTVGQNHGADFQRLIEGRRKFIEGLDANRGEINLDIFEDFYPDRAHFVYELLQNAEDAGATEVSFTLLPDRHLCEHDRRPHVSVWWVLPNPDNRRIICGYYTQSAYSVRLPELPAAVTKKLPHYPEVPAALLGRIAVDCSCQRQGLGGHLMLDAMSKVLAHSKTMGTVVLVVDGKNEKSAAYYGAHGFTAFPGAPVVGQFEFDRA